MSTKNKKFQLRLTNDEYAALMRLANDQQMTMTAVLVNFIRREAKLKGVWREKS